MRVQWTTVALIAIAVICFDSPAAAYVDPGSSSMMLQMIVGGVAAIMVLTRQLWTAAAGRTTRFFQRGAKASNHTAPRDRGN